MTDLLLFKVGYITQEHPELKKNTKISSVTFPKAWQKSTSL